MNLIYTRAKLPRCISWFGFYFSRKYTLVLHIENEHIKLVFYDLSRIAYQLQIKDKTYYLYTAYLARSVLEPLVLDFLVKDTGTFFEEKLILSFQILLYFGFKLQNINVWKTNATQNEFGGEKSDSIIILFIRCSKA